MGQSSGVLLKEVATFQDVLSEVAEQLYNDNFLYFEL